MEDIWECQNNKRGMNKTDNIKFIESSVIHSGGYMRFSNFLANRYEIQWHIFHVPLGQIIFCRNDEAAVNKH